jgi:uncharacterized phage protein (TIGR02218 family)
VSGSGLFDHLAEGTTTVARAWRVTRKDGRVFGFTDHDRDLMIGGVMHRAGSGLTARALQMTTGLSVDNTEVAGLLSDLALREEDLAAGRFDGAVVEAFLVDWSDPTVFQPIFRGTIGEVGWQGASFRAELRGVSEALNQPIGYAYTRQCSAVLGDARCRFDLLQPGYFADRVLETIEEAGRILSFSGFTGFEDRWFEGGRLEVRSGAAEGLSAMIKVDRLAGGIRRIELWQSIRAPMQAGDEVRLLAGCDRTAATCRSKFANFLNFRGFPHIPGDDWITSYPRPGQPADGGSLFGGTTAGA